MLLESASELPYKIYITVGFITGTISSVVSGHLNDAIFTFILGLLSALGAAFGKYIITIIKRQRENRKEGELK